MGTESSALAGQLLRAVKAPEVVDTLFDHLSRSEVSRWSALTPGAPPTPEKVKQLVKAKGRTHHLVVETAVAACDDAATLYEIRRDSRKGVRRKIAANPHTNLDTRNYLWEWAFKHNDTETFQGLIATSDLAEELDRVMSVPSFGHVNYPSSQLVREVLRSSDKDLWLKLTSGHHSHMIRELFARMTNRGPGSAPLTADELLDSLGQWYEEMLDTLVGNPKITLDVDLAVRLRQRADQGRYQVRVNASVTDAAAAVLCDSPSPFLRMAAARANNPDRRTIDTIVELGPAAAVEIIACQPLPKDVAVRIVNQYQGVPPRYTRDTSSEDSATFHAGARDRVLQNTPNLPTDIRITILRQGDISLTYRWLVGDTANDPRPGEVVELLSDPGRAFSRHHEEPIKDPEWISNLIVTSSVTNRLYSGSNRAPIATVMLSRKQPWADEVLEMLPGLLSHVTFDSYDGSVRKPVSDWVVDRLGSKLGTNPDAFDMLLRMCKDFEGSTVDLIETVAAMFEIDCVDANPFEPDGDDAEGSDLDDALVLDEEDSVHDHVAGSSEPVEDTGTTGSDEQDVPDDPEPVDRGSDETGSGSSDADDVVAGTVDVVDAEDDADDVSEPGTDDGTVPQEDDQSAERATLTAVSGFQMKLL